MSRSPQDRAWRVRTPPAAAPAPTSRWDIRTAPIDAADMEGPGIVVRWLAGLVFVGYSIITTTIIIGSVLNPLLRGGIDVGVTIPYSLLIGMLVGVGVTFGEWATVTKAPGAHWFLVLVCDAPFSAWQTYIWAMIIAVAKLTNPGTGVTIAIMIGSIIWGIVTAKLGEKLLLNRG